MIVIVLLCAAVLVAAIALAAAVRALVRECRAEAAAERQDATDPLVKAALAVHADEAEDEGGWWLEDGEQRLPAALAVAHVAGACAETSCDLWAGWPSGAFRAADAALASGWVPGGPVPLPCGDLAERMRQRLDERAEQAS